MTLGQAAAPWPADVVRETVASIAAQDAYQRTIGVTLWQRLWGLLGRILEALFEWAGASGVSRVLTIGGVVLLVALIVARIVVVVLAARARGRSGPGAHPGWTTDPRAEAERLAAAGRFTEAAHALLSALLLVLAARGDVRLHDSKTTGDYARELERRGSPARAAFQRFRRRYEGAIYGAGACSAEDFAALARDAEPALLQGVPG